MNKASPSAPRTANPYYYLEQLIQERAPWIVKKLQEMETHRLPQRTWTNGERLLLLGDELELNIYRSHRRAEPIRSVGKIWVGVPDTQALSVIEPNVPLEGPLTIEKVSWQFSPFS